MKFSSIASCAAVCGLANAVINTYVYAVTDNFSLNNTYLNAVLEGDTYYFFFGEKSDAVVVLYDVQQLAAWITDESGKDYYLAVSFLTEGGNSFIIGNLTAKADAFANFLPNENLVYLKAFDFYTSLDAADPANISQSRYPLVYDYDTIPADVIDLRLFYEEIGGSVASLTQGFSTATGITGSVSASSQAGSQSATASESRSSSVSRITTSGAASSSANSSSAASSNASSNASSSAAPSSAASSSAASSSAASSSAASSSVAASSSTKNDADNQVIGTGAGIAALLAAFVF